MKYKGHYGNKIWPENPKNIGNCWKDKDGCQKFKKYLQQVFNDFNQHYSWIVAENQRGYVDGQLDNAKISMDNVFQVIFAKPPDKNTCMENETKEENTWIDALCLARGIKQ